MGPWQWQERDSEWYGDYLNTRRVAGVRVRVHQVPSPRATHEYGALLEIERDSAATQAEIDAVQRSLLDKIDVRKTKRIAPHD